jgi:hypothetical protein
MRKITLSLLALMVYATAYCGVPQAISYQAVALNASGQPIKNQNIALRLSVLAGSPTGTLDYQERQSSITDNSGVISVQIGNGSVLSGTFASINWSAGVYYLETEMDTTGGTNYTVIGTVQFFSVPYALYSGSAAAANLSSPDYPDGLNSIVPVSLSGSFSYSVPAGNTLYVTSITQNGSATCTNYGVAINGVFIASNESGGTSAGVGGSSSGLPSVSTNKMVTNYPFGLPAGYSINSTTCGTALTGFTIPTGYSWVAFDLSTGNYTVPTGKVLVIKNMISSTTTTWNGFYNIGSNSSAFSNATFVDQGQTVSASSLTGSLLMMGYLKTR